jgi:hypothetical protein
MTSPVVAVLVDPHLRGAVSKERRRESDAEFSVLLYEKPQQSVGGMRNV